MLWESWSRVPSPLFSGGMNIFEGLTIASEIVDAIKWQGKGIVFKINFEKAYDCVDCDFL